MYEAKKNMQAVSRRIGSGDAKQMIRQMANNESKHKNLTQNKNINNKYVSQLTAWVITRELNLGMSQSSNSKSSSLRAQQGNNIAGSSHGSSDRIGGAVFSGITLSPAILPIVGSDSSTGIISGNGSKYVTSKIALKDKDPKNIDAKHIINQKGINNLDLTNRSNPLEKIFNLKFHHRHILFDQTHKLPIVGESNNIGYGGVLYKETSLDGYIKNNKITECNPDDSLLIRAIEQCKNFGSYNLLTNNCQHWVNKVVYEYNYMKKNKWRKGWNRTYRRKRR